MNQLRAPEQGARNSRCGSFPIFVEFLRREQAQRVLLIKLLTFGVLKPYTYLSYTSSCNRLDTG